MSVQTERVTGRPPRQVTLTPELRKAIREGEAMRERLLRENERITATIARRDAAIRVMDEAGMTLRAIGKVVGLTPARVQTVLERPS